MRRLAAMALTTLAALGLFHARGLAQCSTGTLIEFDADCFAWETNYDPATYTSTAGSQLNVVGIVAYWCSPFQDLDANDPNTEYTFLFSGLTSLGTQPVGPVGGVTSLETDYGSGVFQIYAGSPRNAPTAAGNTPSGPMPINPPNATVPANFTDGTLILEGTLAGFHTSITTGGASDPNGSFRSGYTFTGPTGGTYYQRVAGTGEGLLTGNWCVRPPPQSSCVPQGYSAHPNGKFDQFVTATGMKTWGALKQIYR